MPQKKSSGGKKEQQGGGGANAQAKPPAGEPALVVPADCDPVAFLVSIVEKKARNLEKRKNKLMALKENADELDKDQKEAITKIKDVSIQLELVKDLQKQFIQAESELAKVRKRQQKQERAQAKEAELVTRQKAVVYTLRVADMLNSLGAEDKENFKTGSEDAAKLSEDELSQIDEFYKLVAPQRSENSSFDSEIKTAGDHMLSLMDSSPKEVVGTTYKGLHGVLQKVDSCGYFDRAHQSIPEDESEEDVDDYKSAEEQPQGHDGLGSEDREEEQYTEEVDIPPEVPPSVEPEAPPEQLLLPSEPQSADHTSSELGVVASPPIMTQTSGIISYMPNAPSPTFPALQGTSPILLSHDSGSFSFMHDSKIDRSQPSPSSMVPPPVHQSMPSAVPALPDHQSPLPPAQHLPQPVESSLPPVAQQPLPPPAQPQPQPHHTPISTYQYDARNSEAGVEVPVIPPPNPTALKSVGGQGTTDVATGQPNPHSANPPMQQPQQQFAPPMDAVISSGMMPSSGGGELVNQDLGGVRGGGSNEVVMYSSLMSGDPGQASFSRQPQPQQSQGQSHHNQRSQNYYQKGAPQPQRRDGRGFNQGGGRRVGGGGGGGGGWNNRNTYQPYKNNRGIDGGQPYNNRGLGGGGFNQQQQQQQQQPRAGGRPNYRTSNGQNSGGPRQS